MSLSRKLAFLLLGLSSCSSNPTLVSLGEVPAQATTLELRPVVGGQAGAAVRAALGALPATKRTLRVELGGALMGAPLLAQVFDDKACLLGYGQAEAGQALTLTAVSGCPNRGLRGPLLDAATPTRISAEQPTQVTLRGAGLLPGVVVKAGVQALPLVWRSPLEVEVTAPASPGGLGKSLTLSASFAGQEAALAAPLRYFEARVTLDAPQLLNDPAQDYGGARLLSGDINGDGRPDLLWGYGPFRILINDTGADHVARFRRLPDLPATVVVDGQNYDSVGSSTLADLNGDGALDLIYTAFSYAANATSTSVVVVRGERPVRMNGNGFLPVKQVVLTLPRAIRALPADVDGDGDLDLILVTRAIGAFTLWEVQVLLNNKGEWTPARSPCKHPDTKNGKNTKSSYEAVVGDLDGDGRSELLLMSIDDANLLYSYRFADLSLCPERSEVRFPGKDVGFAPALGDWGSGPGALFGFGANSPRLLLPSDGRGGFALSDIQQQPATVGWPRGFHTHRLVDLNGDGRDDLLTFGGTSDIFLYSLALSLSRGGTAPFATQDLLIPLPYDKALDAAASSIQVADMDGDGRPDVITGSNVSGVQGPIYLFRNLPTP